MPDELSEAKQAVDDQKVDWPMLLRISNWRKLPDKPENTPKREFAAGATIPAVTAFKQTPGVKEVGLAAGVGGVYLCEDGRLHAGVNSQLIRFDWSAAQNLIFRIDALTGQVAEWWPANAPRRKWQSEQGHKRRLAALNAERQPHAARLYGLVTFVLGATADENDRHAHGGIGRPKPSEQFTDSLELLSTQWDRAREEITQAAQRRAQARYARGMLYGAGAIALLCVVLGAVFAWRDADAAWAVAVPAGALGALVSVFQRMTTHRLTLDFQAAGSLLETYGAVRPAIGAILGMAVVTLIAGGMLPAIVAPTGCELAFNAALGFLAGFNERFAQDMLAGSTPQVGSSSQVEDTAVNTDDSPPHANRSGGP